MIKTIVYLGNNDLSVYKRGVENVIWFQSRNNIFNRIVYIALCERNAICHWDNFICIYIKRDKKCYIQLNKIILYLKRKYKDVFIHSHSPILSCALYCKTDLLTVHDAIYYERKSGGQWNYPIFALVEWASAIKVKHIHYISRFTREKSLLKGIFKNRSTLIYNTTPLELMTAKDLPVDFAINEINIFTVRGLQKRNRIDLLYNLAKDSRSLLVDGKKIHYYVAGKGPLLVKYQKLAKEEGTNNISFLGFVDDEKLINYYRKCDMVLVITEFAEGFGLPVIEGYLYNKAVIASSKCAIPEVIIDKKYLFENNTESIIKTLCNAINFRDQFMDYYNANFCKDIIITQYNHMYMALVKRTGL